MILLDDGACGHYGHAGHGLGHHGEIVATRDRSGAVATAAVNNCCSRCGMIPPARDSGQFPLWDGELRWTDEQREASIVQLLSPDPPQPPALQGRLDSLLRRLQEANATTRQYSAVFVPFIHAVLQSGEMAEDSAAWATHDPVWGQLADEYRDFFATTQSPSLAHLLQPGQVRGMIDSVTPGRYPYVMPALPGSDPAQYGHHDQPWPLVSGMNHITQETFLGQSPQLFDRLQGMILRWVTPTPPPHASVPPPVAAPPAAAPPAAAPPPAAALPAAAAPPAAAPPPAPRCRHAARCRAARCRAAR